MSDDKLLETLGRAARENARDDPFDERWDAFSRGELDEDQIEALATLADDGTVARDAVEAFRPLGEDFRKTLAARAAETLATHGDTGTSTGGGTAGGSPPIPFPAARPKPRSRMNFAPAALAASVMLAVGIGFFAVPRTSVEPIPGYSVFLQGGASSRSGNDTSATPVFRPGDRVELRLTPATAVDGPVAARVYIDTAGGLEALATPPVTIAASGAVRIVGQNGSDIVLPPGDSNIVVVLGRDGALPEPRRLGLALADQTGATGRGWQAWRLAVTTEP